MVPVLVLTFPSFLFQIPHKKTTLNNQKTEISEQKRRSSTFSKKNKEMNIFRLPRITDKTEGNYGWINMAGDPCEASAPRRSRRNFRREGTAMIYFYPPFFFFPSQSRKYSLEAGILASGTFLARSCCYWQGIHIRERPHAIRSFFSATMKTVRSEPSSSALLNYVEPTDW